LDANDIEELKVALADKTVERFPSVEPRAATKYIVRRAIMGGGLKAGSLQSCSGPERVVKICFNV